MTTVEMPKNKMISEVKEGVLFNQCCCSAMCTADKRAAMDAATAIKNLSKRYSFLSERYTITIMPTKVPRTSKSKKTGKENPKY